MTITDRIESTGQKRILTLDGGGIRGLITVEVLAQIEDVLRARYPREKWAGDDFRLSDYFDYVAGTSTGAIIATCISLGMSVAQIRRFYRDNGHSMFDKARLLRRFRYKFEDEALSAKLREVIDQFRPEAERYDRSGREQHLTLGSSALKKTLLLVVMRMATPIRRGRCPATRAPLQRSRRKIATWICRCGSSWYRQHGGAGIFRTRGHHARREELFSSTEASRPTTTRRSWRS